MVCESSIPFVTSLALLGSSKRIFISNASVQKNTSPNVMNPLQWSQHTPNDDSSSDDFLFAPRAPASVPSTASQPSDPIFPLASLPTSSQPQSSHFQPSSFLSSDESSSDDQVFTPSVITRRRTKPRTIAGSRTSFILGGKLGEGAYGIVREGIDENSLRIVAVKILDMRRMRKIRGGPESIEREIAVQKRLKRHPNLIELIDVIRTPDKGKIYIVLEMANGCTVQQLADGVDDGRLPESQVANYAFQTLQGLQYMHEKGVVHRDIKPSNMMLTASGDLKISDFGVAEFLNEYNIDDNVSRTSGSPAFQAPEIATGALDYSGRKVDVWALGVSVYYLLTGKIPFEADNLLVLFELIGKGKYEEPEWMNETCKDVIRSMLTVNWEKRVSIEELLKHPWVVRGSQQPSLTQQHVDREWVLIPKKDLHILEIVKDLYRGDEPPPEAVQPSEQVTGADQSEERSICNVA